MENFLIEGAIDTFEFWFGTLKVHVMFASL